MRDLKSVRAFRAGRTERGLPIIGLATFLSAGWSGCASDPGGDDGEGAAGGSSAVGGGMNGAPQAGGAGGAIPGATGGGGAVPPPVGGSGGVAAGGAGGSDAQQCSDLLSWCENATAGACVDVMTSAEHCGRCGAPCAAGQTCSAGMCQGPPAPGDAGPGPTGAGCGVAWSPADAAVEEIRWMDHQALVARRTMTVQGVERSYLVAVPVDYDPARPYPLIFAFHGAGGDREQLRGYMNVEIPAQGDAIVLYPEGLVLPDRGSTGWDLDADSDDLVFVDQLYAKYSAELCVDLGRVFATGHSFGGCMSNSVGCFRGNVFRAIAPVAGCGPFSRAECVGQVASLQLHSSKDTSTGYGGAIAACTRQLRANGCDESPDCGCHWVDDLESPEDECVQEAQVPYATQVVVETTEQDDAPPVLRQYVGCDADYPVAFADHWHREDRDGREERWHNPPPWAEALIWEFFSRLGPIDPQ